MLKKEKDQISNGIRLRSGPYFFIWHLKCSPLSLRKGFLCFFQFCLVSKLLLYTSFITLFLASWALLPLLNPILFPLCFELFLLNLPVMISFFFKQAKWDLDQINSTLIQLIQTFAPLWTVRDHVVLIGDGCKVPTDAYKFPALSKEYMESQSASKPTF